MTELKKEVKEMLESYGFKVADLPKSDLTNYKTHIATYVVRIKPEGREYFLNCSVFQDGYHFSIMDNCGIIKLISLKEDTPTYVLSKYIEKTADFFGM